GRQTFGETLGIFNENISDPVDSLEQRHLDEVDARDRCKTAIGMPHERVRSAEIGKRLALRRQPLDGVGNALKYIGLARGTGGGVVLGRGGARRCGFRFGRRPSRKSRCSWRGSVAPAGGLTKKGLERGVFCAHPAVAIGRPTAIVRANSSAARAPSKEHA